MKNKLILKSIKKIKSQRNIVQMKEQSRNTQDQINKEEIGKLPEKAFRVMIVKMFQNLENRMEKMQETINTISEDTEEIKYKQTEMKNTTTEMKNTLERTNSRLAETEE